jgi:hypothetical protein
VQPTFVAILSRSMPAAMSDSACACCSGENRRLRAGMLLRAPPLRGRVDCWEPLPAKNSRISLERAQVVPAHAGWRTCIDTDRKWLLRNDARLYP